VAVLTLAAHMLLSSSWRLSVGLLVIVAGTIIWGRPFELRFSKSYQETDDNKPIYEKWTPTARLTFFDSVFWVPDRYAGFAWGPGRKARRRTVDQYWIEQDGSAGTPVTRYRGNLDELGFLMEDVTAVGYELRSPERVAIIGAGGGRDILAALIGGAKEIDAIEFNGQIIEAISTRFKEFSGDIYNAPGVNAVVAEGRSFLSRSRTAYDFIQISLIDSWAATSAGAFTLAENNLYTLEAYRVYFERLSARGILSTSRWMMGHRGNEMPRLLMLTLRALRDEGIRDPERHIAVVQGGLLGTVLVSKAPFSPSDVDRLIAISRARGFTLHFPRTRVAPRKSMPLEVLTVGAERWERAGFDLSPPVDDKPFFFLTFSPFQRLDKWRHLRYGPNATAVLALQRLILCMGIAALVLFFAPFLLARWFRRERGFVRGSLFFAMIGAAFMLVEVPWVQRFILYLGHPSYATTVVLASILLGAAVGSMVSVRVGLPTAQRLGLALPAALALVNAALSALFESSLGAPFSARVLFTAIVLLPAAFLMGFFFPLGMVRFGDTNKPWFWAMNGAFGVLASVLSLALSMRFGFTQVVYMGIGLYAVAWIALLGTSVRPERQALARFDSVDA
jgi:spermidine synthase